MAPFLFEFMDQEWIPASLHATLRDVLGFHLRVTLFYYYRWAAREALDAARTTGAARVSELGAGSAGFSEALATLIREHASSVRVEISDLRPNTPLYRSLEAQYPGIVHACTEPVDFTTRPHAGHERDIVVLSAAFHHVPREERPRVLQAMASRRVMIFESVTRNLKSMVGCAIGFLPAMLTPLYFIGRRSGRWRRMFWCWVVPVAPVMVAWDGVVSCLRCWTEDEWRERLKAAGVGDDAIAIERRGFSHVISWAHREEKAA
jgi:hypothetical protein